MVHYLRVAFSGAAPPASRCRGDLKAFVGGQPTGCPPGPCGEALATPPLAAGSRVDVPAAAGLSIEQAFPGLVLDLRATTIANAMQPLIEFPGTSRTSSGDRVTASRGSATGPASGSYPWSATGMLGGDHALITGSGMALVIGSASFGDRALTGTWIPPLANGAHPAGHQPWRFTCQPQRAVVNHGAEGVTDGERPADAESAATDASSLLPFRSAPPRARCAWAMVE